jgi:hypothetical protein
VVIDVDMADVHEELVLGGSAGHVVNSPAPASSPRSLPSPAGSQRSLPSSGALGALSRSSLGASQRSLPPEFAPGPSLGAPDRGAAPAFTSGSSLGASQRSLPPEFGPGTPGSGTPSSTSMRSSQRSLPPPPPRPSRQMKTVASSDASGAFRVGVSLRNRGQYEQAIGEFEKAMGDAKRGARAALMSGLCYRDQNRTRDAIEAFKLGIHMPDVSDPDRNELYYQLGRSYELLNDVKEAIYFYQSAQRKEGRFRDCADRITALQAKK